MGQLIPPAPGLNFLTTRQLTELDAKLAELSAQSRRAGQGMQLTLILNENGMLTSFAEPLLVSKIKQRG